MILVVGGAGYIGSHVVRLLVEQNAQVIVFDNLSAGHEQAVPRNIPLFEGDLLDKASLSRVFQEYPAIDTVMHFGASISVGESVRNPSLYYRNNVTGTLSLLDAMVEAGVSKLVFSSTAATYGEPQQVPIPESHPKHPTSPYGHSKLVVEQILQAYEVAYGLRSVIFRYFNASGAHPSAQIGEDHRPEEHLIPVAIKAAQGLRPSLKLFGTDYPTPDGTCVRDYIHVCDLAEAHWKGVQWLADGKPSETFNLGNGEGYSVRQVVELVSEVTGMQVPFETADRRAGDPAVLVASSAKAKELLGWEPQRPQLKTIIEDAWRWHSTHPNGYGD